MAGGGGGGPSLADISNIIWVWFREAAKKVIFLTFNLRTSLSIKVSFGIVGGEKFCPKLNASADMS